MAETMADGFTSDDRRRVVNAGVRRGRDVAVANMRAVAEVGFENLAVDRHCDSRAAPGPESYSFRGARAGARGGRHRVHHDRRDRRRQPDRGERICSTSTTSTPRSPNSTPDTSPAKPPPTRTRGRSSRGPTPHSTGTSFPRRRRTGSASTIGDVTTIEAGDMAASIACRVGPHRQASASTSRRCIG